MRFTVIGDIHLSRITESRNLAYVDTLNKLEYVADASARLGSKILVLTGDIFDNLNQYIPAGALTRFADILRSFEQVWYIMGNHDWHRSAGYEAHDEPVALLEKMSGNMRRLDDSSMIFDQEGKQHYVIARPWRKSFDLGNSVDLECPAELDPANTVMLCHAYLLPSAKNPLGMYNSIEVLKRPAMFYVVGHYHGRLGMLKYPVPGTDRDFYVLIPGSFTRIKSDETHSPAMFVVDIVPGSEPQVTTLEVPCRPHSEVFVSNEDDKVIQAIKDEISGFVSSLSVSREPMSKDGFLTTFKAKADDVVPEDRRDDVYGFIHDVISNL